MDIISKDEFKINLDMYLDKIEKGAVFIYPTDTIYGLGCNAADSKAVARIREMKKRTEMPFSVMAPDKKWIYDNCLVEGEGIKWVEKLPGPYTLIFKLQNKKAVSNEVNCGWGTLGVRIPKNWFQKLTAKLNMPIVTTSANITGQDYMTSVDDLDDSVKANVDFCVSEGEKKGKPSTIVNLVEQEPEIKVR